MKDKYFNINKLYVGCLGTMTYIDDQEYPEWNKKINFPYAIYRVIPSASLDNCHEGIDIFSGEKYYFLNEVSRRKSTLEIAYGKYIISKSIPLTVVCGSDKDKLSSIELKSIICNFNLTEAIIKNKNNNYLVLLNTCLKDIDLMEEGKVKEYYMNNILTLISKYTSIINAHVDEEEYNKIIEDINRIRHELDREKEIIAKKRKKVR